MKLGVFVSEYGTKNDTLERLKADFLGIVLVQNGVYNAVVSENGQSSPVLGKGTKIYALSEDLLVRGFEPSKVAAGVTVVDYSGLVDLIFNDFEKLIWL
jgi:tRNA 2-thiouridine synthesizing protein B